MRSLKISLFCFFSLLPVLVFGESVVYFGLRSDPPIDIPQGVTVCYLDDATTILQAVNADLKNDPTSDPQAISGKYSAQFQAIADSTKCQYQAATLGITQLPAVVVDNNYVVYGNNSITTALQEIEGYKGMQHVG